MVQAAVYRLWGGIVIVTTTPFRILRLKYHVTLIDIAAKIGVKNQNLSDWERGQVYVTADRQKRAADSFIRLAEERIQAYQQLKEELLLNRDHLLTPMEVERDEL